MRYDIVYLSDIIDTDLTHINNTQQAIDSSLMTFVDIMPFWSSRFNEGIKIIAETDEINAQAELIEADVAKLSSEILAEESKLADAERTVKSRQAKVAQLQAILKKKKEGCTIL